MDFRLAGKAACSLDLPLQPLKEWNQRSRTPGERSCGLFSLDPLLGAAQGLGQAAGLQMQTAQPLVGEGGERPSFTLFS